MISNKIGLEWTNIVIIYSIVKVTFFLCFIGREHISRESDEIRLSPSQQRERETMECFHLMAAMLVGSITSTDVHQSE